jgi:hypothetical protein
MPPVIVAGIDGPGHPAQGRVVGALVLLIPAGLGAEGAVPIRRVLLWESAGGAGAIIMVRLRYLIGRFGSRAW